MISNRYLVEVRMKDDLVAMSQPLFVLGPSALARLLGETGIQNACKEYKVKQGGLEVKGEVDVISDSCKLVPPVVLTWKTRYQDLN